MLPTTRDATISMQIDIIIKAWDTIKCILNDIEVDDETIFKAVFGDSQNFSEIEDAAMLLLDAKDRIDDA